MNRKTGDLIESIPKDAYFIIIVGDKETPHIMNGEHESRSAVSPNTGLPLLRLLEIESTSFLIPGPKCIALYYEWVSGISEGPFSYRMLDEGAVEILSLQRGKQSTDFPYKNYPNHFPKQFVEMQKMSGDEQRTIIAMNSGEVDPHSLRRSSPHLAMPIHQLGGIPYGAPEFETCICPQCREEMKFLASIGDDAGSGCVYVDNSFVSVIFQYCVKCAIITAFNICD